MILNVSGRTDIVAFYTKWFINRYREGYVMVRNPFYPKLVSKINFKDVDLILFCTKNPLPIIPYLKDIDKKIIFHTTLTPYKKDIEPNVIEKSKIIEGVKEISKIIGKENTVVRYDPIFISDKYNIDYHKKNFEVLCTKLDGYIDKIIVSFIDEYKNTKKNMKDIRYKPFTEEIYKEIGSLSKIANKHNITIQTCFEDRDLTEYGFIKGECLSKELAFKMTGKIYDEEWKARKGDKCHCVKMVDIGVYNSCNHMCKYCYANYDEKKVLDNMKNHNPNSPLLIGELMDDDIIKERIK